MKNKCKFVGIMFLCILIVCTLAVMAYEHAYEHTAGKTGAAGEMSDASDSAKNTDEADDMLSMGFKDDLDTIFNETPSEKQTLLFSATMS